MSQARSDLQTRLSIIRKALAEGALSDGAPAAYEKNAIAAVLRNGVSVLIFATLEAFVRSRTAEVLRGFSGTAVGFNDLSDRLQQAVTLSALRGVLFRSGSEDKASQVAWTLAALPSIANASTNITQLSEYSFGHTSSNVGKDEVGKILSAFGIEGGWAEVSAVAKAVGLGGIAEYSQSFVDIADRRHSAAHDVTTTVPLNDLVESLKIVVAIACGFDLLLSHSLSKHNLREFPTKAAPIKAAHLKYRFIAPHPTQAPRYREQTLTNSGARRTVRVHATRAVASAAVLPRAHTAREQVVVLSLSGVPEDWHTW